MLKAQIIHYDTNNNSWINKKALCISDKLELPPFLRIFSHFLMRIQRNIIKSSHRKTRNACAHARD